jgi:hypothetical protein
MSPKRILRILMAALITATLLPGLAAATEQTGKIRGTVTDGEGEPIVGATIVAASESMQGLREVVTGETGTYWMPGLPPGTYEVKASADGFQSWLKQDIRINIGASLNIDIQLGSAEVTQTVTVVDERPVIDTATSTATTVVTREYLEALPARRSYQSAVQFTPGVTGGSNPNAQGGHSSENKWLLDGANTSDPVTGTFSMNFNLDAIDEIEVITGAFRAENGGSLGAIINVRTKSGSNKLEGGVKAFFGNGNWSPRRDGTFTPRGDRIEGSEFDRESQSYSINAYFGGPLVKDKIWFFTSFQYIRNLSTALGARSPQVFDGYNLFGKVTVSPFPRNQFILSVQNGPANISNRLQSSLVDPDAQNYQHQNSLIITGEWRWQITNNVLARVHYSHLDTDIDSTPQPCTWVEDNRFKQCKGDQPEGFVDFTTPGVIGSAGARWEDNYYRISINDRRRDAIRATVTGYALTPIGSHEIKGGAEFASLSADNLFGYTGNLYYVDRLEDGNDASSQINWYWRESQGQLYQNNSGLGGFVFLQDTWEPVPGLTIDLGVKYDHTDLKNDIGESIVAFDFVSPVGGISWDPANNQRAKIYAGGGIVLDEGRLSIAGFLDKNGLGRKLWLGPYYDNESNFSFDQWSSDSGQSNYEKYDQLTVPRVYNIVAGFEVNLGAQTKVGMEGAVKLFRNLWEDDEVNYIWNEDGTDTVGVVNGLQDNFFRLRTPDAAERNWFGLTFKLQRQMYKNLLLDINYTYSMTRGLTASPISAALDNPTQRPYEYGWLYIDRPHVVKASAAYLLPYGFQVGGTFNFISGSRFDRRFSSKGGSYNNFVAEIGTFDSVNPWWSVDLKVMYKAKLPYGKLFASVEMSNITNNRQATGINTGVLNSGGEYYASGRQAPMTLELGFGYEF